MGLFNDVGRKVREYFRSDKESQALQLAKGATNAMYPAASGDTLSAYGYDSLSDHLRIEHDLLSRFVDYEEMDDYPEVAAAVDIFADDSTVPDTQINRTLWTTSPDKSIQTELDDLFHRTLRMDEEVWEIARTLCKYGNDYEELLVTQEGVKGLNFLAPATARRIEGPRGELYGFIQDYKARFGQSPQEFQQILAARLSALKSGTGATAQPQDYTGRADIVAFEDWEVVHFRLRGKYRRSVYGHSVLEPARWIWKRLLLLEDAALVYRLQRAPERFAFYIDVGDLPPAEAMAYVNRVRHHFKKKKFYNPQTGKLDLKFDPLSQDEDFFVPTRKGTDGARIEVLGAPAWQHMDDIEYFRDKLFAALKVPKAYLAQDQNVNRAALSSEDVRFARTVLRVQRELRNGFAKIARVHLAAIGIDPSKVEYDIHMTTPSSIFELAQLEVRNAKADLAGRMNEFVSLHWVLSKIFGLSDKEIEEIIKERKEDVKRTTSAAAEAEAEAQKLLQPQQPDAGGEVPFPGQEPAQGEPGQEPEPAEARVQPKYGITERLKRRTASVRRMPITERELFHGSREAEKRAGEKYEKLLQNDQMLAKRMDELGGFLRDLKGAKWRK